MKLIDLHQILTVDILSQRSFTARFVRYQRFQHRTNHVQLRRRRPCDHKTPITAFRDDFASHHRDTNRHYGAAL